MADKITRFKTVPDLHCTEDGAARFISAKGSHPRSRSILCYRGAAKDAVLG